MCELVGADVDHVRRAIGADRRIGTSFLFPGRRLRRQLLPEGREGAPQVGQDHGYDFKILHAVEAVNHAQKDRAGRQDAGAFREPEGQDDRGVGAGVQAAHRRHARGAGDRDHRGAAGRGRDRPRATIRRRPRRRGGIFGDRITLCDKSYDALAGADALAVVTEWNTFREPDFDEDAGADAVARRLRRPQHLFTRADARARLHLFLHWPVTRGRSS